MAKRRKKRRKLRRWFALLIILVIGGFVLLMGMHSHTERNDTVPVMAEPVTESVTEPEMQFDKDDPNLMLVNKEHRLSEDYAPDNLVTLSSSVSANKEHYMQSEAAGAFEELVAGAADDELTIKAVSTYRTYEYQDNLYNYYLSTKGEEWTKLYSAPPGASEHHTGLAVDVSCASMGYGLDTSFAETTEGIWIAEHAWEYGFIVRYLDGAEDVTGYAYEPWHIRYVGEDAAKIITEKGITLEEFLSEI